MPPPSPREHPLRGALPVALATALLVQFALRSVPERHGYHLATTAIPSNWSALPVTASITGTIRTKDDDDWGSIRHVARLGELEVRWENMLYKGLDAGEQSWRLTHPELREMVDKSTATTCWDHPTELREDAATGIIVAVSGFGSKACVAFRREPFVEPARNVTIVHRLLAAALVTAPILLAALVVGAVRRRDA